MSKYTSMTIPQLRDLLKTRGFKQSGRKKELIARLEALDSMSHEVDAPEPLYSMELPSPSLYKDIHSGSLVPKVSRDDITTYYSLYEKTFEEKYSKLYKEGFLKFIRMSCDEGKAYVTATVYAEMRKSALYKVDILLQKGAVDEAQCECGAGQGPAAHCKHVGCVLYALHDFQSSKVMITERTCTERLQTFHRVTPNTGSPVKAVNVRPVRRRLSHYNPLHESDCCDSEYGTYFRNVILNHGNMAATQATGIANLHGLNDHSYAGDPVNAFLRGRKLLTITAEERIQLEHSTRGQTANKLWHHEHAVRLTASNFYRICLCTTDSSKCKLAEEYLHPKSFNSKATAHGIKYESAALATFKNKTGNEVRACGLFVCESAPFLGASPDGITASSECIEVKCPYAARGKQITPLTVPYLVSVDGYLELKKNHAYYYQVQGQMLCSDLSVCHFCVFTLSDFKSITIHRDNDFIKTMLTQLKDFFTEFLKPVLAGRYVFKCQ